MALSSVTTVHVQQPKRELPQDGVLLSIAKGLALIGTFV